MRSLDARRVLDLDDLPLEASPRLTSEFDSGNFGSEGGVHNITSDFESALLEFDEAGSVELAT